MLQLSIRNDPASIKKTKNDFKLSYNAKLILQGYFVIPFKKSP